MPRLCDVWMIRIKDVEREYRVARLAMDRLQSDVVRDSSLFVTNEPLRMLRTAAQNLSDTYFLRLFAEFEGGLRSWWCTVRPTEPRTEDLLNGIAGRRSVPRSVLEQAHSLRQRRNDLIHERLVPPTSLSIAEARRNLCLIFSRLPPTR